MEAQTPPHIVHLAQEEWMLDEETHGGQRIPKQEYEASADVRQLREGVDPGHIKTDQASGPPLTLLLAELAYFKNYGQPSQSPSFSSTCGVFASDSLEFASLVH